MLAMLMPASPSSVPTRPTMPGDVVVAQQEQAAGELDLERQAVHAHEPGAVVGAEHRAHDGALVRVAHRDGQQVRVVGGARAVLLGHLDAAARPRSRAR